MKLRPTWRRYLAGIILGVILLILGSLGFAGAVMLDTYVYRHWQQAASVPRCPLDTLPWTQQIVDRC